MRRSLRPLGTLVVLALSCVPTDLLPHGCTSAGCGPPLHVQFMATGTWPSGTYRVDVNSDGQIATCEQDLPLVCSAPDRCTGLRTWMLLASTCNNSSVPNLLDGIVFTRQPTPRTVEIRVLHGDRPIGSGRFTPSYRTVHPNGSDCEPTCRVARETLRIEF